MLSSNFFNTFFFIDQFQVYNKRGRRHRFLTYLLSPHRHSLCHYQHYSSEWYYTFFFIKDESTLTHHNHCKSIVYQKFCYWCCVFCGFRQMHNDIHPSFEYHTDYFYCPKNPLYSSIIFNNILLLNYGLFFDESVT